MAFGNLAAVPGLEGLAELQAACGLRLAAIGDLPRRALLAERFPRSFPDPDLFTLLPFTDTATLLVETDLGEGAVRDAIYHFVPLAGLVEWRVRIVCDLDEALAALPRRAWMPAAALSLAGFGDRGVIDPLDAGSEFSAGSFSFRPPPANIGAVEEPATLLRILDYVAALFEVQPRIRLSVADISVVVEGARSAVDAFAAAAAYERANDALFADAIRRFTTAAAGAASTEYLEAALRWTGLEALLERFPEPVRLRFLQIVDGRRRRDVLLDSTWRAGTQFRLPLTRDAWETGSAAETALSSLVGDVPLEHDRALLQIAPVTVAPGEAPAPSRFDGEFFHVAIPLDGKTSTALDGYRESDLAAVLAFGAYDETVTNVPGLLFPVPSVFTVNRDEQAYVTIRINALGLPSAIGPILEAAGIPGRPTVSVIVLGATGVGRDTVRDARMLELVPAPSARVMA